MQFNRDFYCIHDNDKEVSCEGLLYYGAAGVPMIDLKEKEAESFRMLLAVLLEEFEIKDRIQEEMLRVLLKRWLIKATRLLNTKKQNIVIHSPKYEILRLFKIALEHHFKESHKVSYYAALLNKAPKTISHIFHELGEKKPIEIIHERIISEAKRLLLYSDFSIKEIAFDLGFETASAFSNLFKKKTGLSPVNYKTMFYK